MDWRCGRWSTIRRESSGADDAMVAMAAVEELIGGPAADGHEVDTAREQQPYEFAIPEVWRYEAGTMLRA